MGSLFQSDDSTQTQEPVNWWKEEGKHNQAEGILHVKSYVERRHGEYEELKESHHSCSSGDCGGDEFGELDGCQNIQSFRHGDMLSSF